jgi:hypothetical protein
MNAGRALFRLWRPIIGCFAGVMLAAELIFAGVLSTAGRATFSPWLVMTVPASKYLLLVVGVMLVGINLRQFVANGATRHEFLAGAALFGLVLALGFPLAMTLGHGLESVLLGALGQRGAGYPVASASSLAGEFARVLPGALAYPVSGALIGAGFYRWRAWTALGVMLLASLPIGVADGLLGIDEFGAEAGRMPYPVALPASLAVTAAAVVAFQRVIRDVPIKRAAG